MRNVSSTVGLALVAGCIVTAFGAEASAQTYVGSETCAECHAESWDDFRKSIHYQTLSSDRWGDARGCEGCHGPGSEHVDSAGEALMMFSAGATHTVDERVDQCLNCHVEEPSGFRFRSSDHVKGAVDCTACHKSHAGARYDLNIPPLAGARTDALDFRPGLEACLQCHQEVRTTSQLNERHRTLEGMVTCGDCHTQHDPSRRTDLGGFDFENCVRCHTDKQGPFVFEHSASRVEGCIACHSPHGSVNRHMLHYQRQAEQCYACHVLVPGFHKGFGPPSAVRFENDSQCTNCHVAIHGSNLNEFFLR